MGRGARRRPSRLGDKLRDIRYGLGGLSQGELIERLGLTGYINRGEISDFERNVREPDLLTLKAYADGAGISVDDLIDDDVDLPKELPASGRFRSSARERPRKRVRRPAVNVAVVTLKLQIKEDIEGEADRVRKEIERLHLKPHGMKRLKDEEYELTVAHHGSDEDLNERIYALLKAIRSVARRRGCSTRVSVREKGGDRYW